MELKDKLKKIRLDNNLTLDELATRLNKYDGINISKGTISRWENGVREPKTTYITSYAKEFEIDLNYLYDVDEVDGVKFEIAPVFKTKEDAVEYFMKQEIIKDEIGIDVSTYTNKEITQFTNKLLDYARFLDKDIYDEKR